MTNLPANSAMADVQTSARQESEADKRARKERERKEAYASFLVTGKHSPRQCAILAGVPEHNAHKYAKARAKDPSFYKMLVKASGVYLESEILPAVIMVCLEIMQKQGVSESVRMRAAQTLAQVATTLRGQTIGKQGSDNTQARDSRSGSPTSLIIEIWDNQKSASSGQVIDVTGKADRLVVEQQTSGHQPEDDDLDNDD